MTFEEVVMSIFCLQIYHDKLHVGIFSMTNSVLSLDYSTQELIFDYMSEDFGTSFMHTFWLHIWWKRE